MHSSNLHLGNVRAEHVGPFGRIRFAGARYAVVMFSCLGVLNGCQEAQREGGSRDDQDPTDQLRLPDEKTDVPENSPETGPPRSRVEAERTQQLRLGVVTNEPAKLIARYSPLVERMATLVGRKQGVVVTDQDQDAMIGNLCGGAIDMMLESSFGASQAMVACDARPIAVEGKGFSFRYNSVIVVEENSPYRHLGDLAGQDVVFEDPGSTSGFIVPRILFQDQGLDLISSEKTPSASQVRYRFGYDELNLIGWVVHGRAAAAGISNQDLSEYEGASLRVIAKTDPIPRQVLSVGGSLPADQIEGLAERLKELSNKPENADLLKNAESLGFAPLTKLDRSLLSKIHGDTLAEGS